MSENYNGGRHRGRSNNGSKQPSRDGHSGQHQSGQNQQARWKQSYDHYCSLAQQSNGVDDVTREQFWQHAEHFLRLINGSALLPA